MRTESYGGIPVAVAETDTHAVAERHRQDGTESDYIVYIHGGAFMLGAAVDTVMLGLVEATGLIAYSIEYDLSPAARYPTALNQCLAAWRALTATRQGRPILVGASAGGNLVLAMLQRLLQDENDKQTTMPHAVVLLSPWANLTPPTAMRLKNEGRDPIIRWNNQLDRSVRAYASPSEVANPLVSPVRGTYSGLQAPVLITTGTNDLFEADCVAMANALRRDQVNVDLENTPHMWHVFQATEAPESERSWRDIAEWISAYLHA